MTIPSNSRMNPVSATVVSVFVFEYQRERQNHDKQREFNRKAIEYREDLLKSTLRRTMTSYNQIKKARRLQRASAVELDSLGKVVVAEQYDKCFDLVNDSQLELDNLVRDVENSAPAFSSPSLLAKQLRSMEGYLSEIITEYEENRGLIPTDTGKQPLEKLPHLSRFIETYSEDSPFDIGVVIPYHIIQKEIRNDLLHPQLPKSSSLQ